MMMKKNKEKDGTGRFLHTYWGNSSLKNRWSPTVVLRSWSKSPGEDRDNCSTKTVETVAIKAPVIRDYGSFYSDNAKNPRLPIIPNDSKIIRMPTLPVPHPFTNPHLPHYCNLSPCLRVYRYLYPNRGRGLQKNHPTYSYVPLPM